MPARANSPPIGWGQGVGLVEEVRSVRAVVQEFKDEFADTLADMQALAESA